jgi:hypothetical protein
MIEIIKEQIEMPKLSEMKFQKKCDRLTDKWYVGDIESGETVYISNFENASLACHNLNKKHYGVSE